MAGTFRLGFKGWKNKIKTTGKMIGGLLLRSINIAERTQYALSSRNFKGDFSLYRYPSRLTAFWIVAPIASFISLYLFNYVVI